MVKVIERLKTNIGLSVKANKYPFISYVVGNNGTGKSRVLAEVAKIYGSEPDGVSTILCVSNAVTDKFTFNQGLGRVKYLGTRSVGNAVHWVSLDRTIAKGLCSGLLRSEGEFLVGLKKILGMEFSIKFPTAQDKENIDIDDLASFVDNRRLKDSEISEKISAVGLRWLMNNLSGRIDLDSVPRQRIKDLLAFLELNPAVSTEVKKKDVFLSFRELSSGEQNRVSLAVKILAHAEDGMLILIDEPEISLHMQWQSEFHSFLTAILEGYKNYHAIIATHSPVIVSEAGRKGRKAAEGIFILEESLDPEVDQIQCQVSSSKDIKSFEFAVLDYFRLATFNTPSFDMKIAELMLSALDAPKANRDADQEIHELMDLHSVHRIPEETQSVIKEAIELIKTHIGKRVEKA